MRFEEFIYFFRSLVGLFLPHRGGGTECNKIGFNECSECCAVYLFAISFSLFPQHTWLTFGWGGRLREVIKDIFVRDGHRRNAEKMNMNCL